MENRNEISSINELKSFMQGIEPLLEDVMTSFFIVKELADKKMETASLLEKLESQFQELSETTKSVKAKNMRIANFLNSILDFTKRDVIHNGSMLLNRNLDFFHLMNEYSSKNEFDYGSWGQMNKRIQQLYLKIYSSYGKCIYEMIKMEVKK